MRTQPAVDQDRLRATLLHRVRANRPPSRRHDGLALEKVPPPGTLYGPPKVVAGSPPASEAWPPLPFVRPPGELTCAGLRGCKRLALPDRFVCASCAADVDRHGDELRRLNPNGRPKA